MTRSPHLHSTMLLLYRTVYPSARHCASSESLYLHSTMLLLYQKSGLPKSGNITFTFHYASTLSDAAAVGSDRVCTFTFHYASTLSGRRVILLRDRFPIYIPLCFYFIWRTKRNTAQKINLHSTMLLLYRKGAEHNIQRDTSFTFHYASTLSREEAIKRFVTTTFTFHYASTLSAGTRCYG